MQPIRVFISHSSKDKPAVEKLALALVERGIEPWLDKWEIGPGDDIVASINAGLEEADAGIIVFSRHSRESRWVEAEVSYLTYARIQEKKVLIPLIVDDDAWVPPLLRHLARRGIEEIEAIADALQGRKGKPQLTRLPEHGLLQRVLISLRREGQSGLRVEVRIGEKEHGHGNYPALPRALVTAQADFLRGFVSGPQRNPVAAERAAQEASVARLGRALGELCFPGDSGEAVVNLIDGCPVGTMIEVCLEAEGAELLGMPFEAIRLPDDRLLAMQPPVIMFRRPADVASGEGQPLAGPLKILVAVGAPDEGYTNSSVLNQERELQNILDAVELAQRRENAQVRILEVGHPEMIGAAVEADAYHVLHLSCHGRPGLLELEDEDGRAVPTTAAELVEALKGKGRPLPLVLLNACHGGVQDGQTASFAEVLLRAGIPGVLAMQTSVSDYYATHLARAFYEHLARREILLASRALAEARKELERDRLEAVQRGAPLFETQPEYATVTLFVAGDERPLADFALDKQPLSVRPVFEVAGPVPQLRIDDLIGRRMELCETLRTLRDDSRSHVGVALTGIGGVGKSAVAGRAMQRLREDGWLVPAHVGRFDLAGIALAIGISLLESDVDSSRKLGQRLVKPDLDDRQRLQLVAQALTQERMALVLDDFEQNLAAGGDAFLDPDVGNALRGLANRAQRGRLLITSRHPVPDMESFFRRIPIPPLSPAESRKLLQRLDALRGFDPAQLAKILKVIGGHPRMLEFLDALQRVGQGRLTHVTQKLQEIVFEHDFDLETIGDDLEESLLAVLMLGARDVFLKELLKIARRDGIDDVLLQAATSNLAVTAGGLVRMLDLDPDDVDNKPSVRRALDRLEDLSLIHRFPGGVWVHRWTAEGLARLDAGAHRGRCIRAGRYRWWRVQHESHSFEDALEAMRNFLAGEDFDAAVGVADVCFSFLRQANQSIMIAALASEVLETLPEEHPGFAGLADQEAQAHLALGATGSAFRRYTSLLKRHERLAVAEPDRADYQRDLSVSYNKVGDLYRALGQGEAAREAYQKSLDIRERLAVAEPDRADYQRDLVVSLWKIGTSDEPDGCEHLKRALAILEFMDEMGRLDKVDEPMIPQLRQLVQERCQTS